jgi:predicted nucleotidyltransferase
MRKKEMDVFMAGNVSRKSKLDKNLPFASIVTELPSIILNSTNKSVIQKIYLFGSYAYGNPTKDSDLDVCVVLDNVEERLKIVIDIQRALLHNKIFECDLLVYKQEQFYRSKNPMSIEHTIMEKGEIIYER